MRKPASSELAGMKHAVDSAPVAYCATTCGARRKKTRCDAISPSTPCTTTLQTQIVVDYHNGFKDVQEPRTIRMIGDPATRYREDPVRIIRAVRFAAKLSPLGFASWKPKTAGPLVKSRKKLLARCAAEPPV